MALPDDEKMRALADPEVRRRLRESAESDTGLFRAMLRWDRLEIGETFATENQGLSGRTVADVAAERGADPFDALLDIVVTDDLRTVLRPPARGDDPESWRLRSEAWRGKISVREFNFPSQARAKGNADEVDEALDVGGRRVPDWRADRERGVHDHPRDPEQGRIDRDGYAGRSRWPGVPRVSRCAR